MPINEILARGAQVPQFMSLADLKRQAYKDELQAQELQGARMTNAATTQQMQSVNALREIFRDPSSIDPDTGMPNRNALTKIFAISPDAGVRITGQMNEMARQREAAETNRWHQALYKMQINDKQADKLNELAVGSLDMFERLVASGIPRDQAVAQVTQAQNEQIDQAAKTGMFSPGQLDRFKGPFDPAKTRAFVAATPEYRTYLQGQKTEDTAPKTRNRIEGENEIQEEWDPKNKTWKKIGQGPRFAKSVTPAGATGVQQSWDNWSEDEKNAFADQAAKDRTLLTGIGRGAQGSKVLLDINQRIVQRSLASGQPGAAERRAQFKADSASLGKLTQTYDAITAFENTALQNGRVLVQLAKKVDSTGFPVIERWIRAGRQNVAGDPDVSEFNAQIQLFGNETAKILSNPSMSGILTDSARREVQEFLPQKASARQIERVVERMSKDFEIRKASTEQQMEAIRTRMEKGYDKPKASPGASPAPGGKELPKITTKAEFDALPSGTEFVAPDGQRRKKK